ncbi:hypothetical protein [Roseitranquillus sediminis]|uniref:hypothetical protein n=1 Tax=Roseitranquillus sediminis TaxID=2809051 RepID=UPI001D0CD111|nr:hypothetical protein [Roseitranquillus sediminis]MBM9595147.1 hypothetical protein [Roseitranquillus sediminis]
MAMTRTYTGSDAGLRARLDRFFAGLGQGFNAYLESRSRIDEIRRLDARSDAELEAMGLRREDIPRHVFRDLLYS